MQGYNVQYTYLNKVLETVPSAQAFFEAEALFTSYYVPLCLHSIFPSLYGGSILLAHFTNLFQSYSASMFMTSYF